MPTPPRFPSPGANLWTKSDPAHAARFLYEVGEWNLAVRDWLEGPDSTALSTGLKEFLLQILVGEMPATPGLRTYGITPFPGLAISERTPEGAVRILNWRSRVVDFLSDVWDVIGDPLFELAECKIALELFRPEATGLCNLCLLPVEPMSRGDHWRTCPARTATKDHAHELAPDGRAAPSAPSWTPMSQWTPPPPPPGANPPPPPDFGPRTG